MVWRNTVKGLDKSGMKIVAKLMTLKLIFSMQYVRYYLCCISSTLIYISSPFFSPLSLLLGDCTCGCKELSVRPCKGCRMAFVWKKRVKELLGKY